MSLLTKQRERINPKHQGPHCAGYCEGAAYSIEIDKLKQETNTAHQMHHLAVKKRDYERRLNQKYKNLVRRVANLNPDSGEIGEGMLKSLVEEARELNDVQ